MISDPAAVRFRLSASQMSVIWPGLNRLIKCCSIPKEKASLYSFPAHLYALPSHFNWGRYSNEMRSVIFELGKRLRQQAKCGGRVQMHAIDIRAAIFAIRVELDWWRRQKDLRRKDSVPAKQLFGVDPESLTSRNKKAQRVIRTLEKHMKRANSRLIAEVGRDAYNAVTSVWRTHIRWIRLHRTYFKPTVLSNRPGKKFYQAILNDAQQIAERTIIEEGFQLPSANKLRPVIRLFAVSSRRGRQGKFGVPALLRGSEFAKWDLFEFVEKRLELKPLDKK